VALDSFCFDLKRPRDAGGRCEVFPVWEFDFWIIFFGIAFRSIEASQEIEGESKEIDEGLPKDH
jgi:hypothetical protein